jgi:hypothetical protein
MNALLRRLAELERKLEDERARVEELCNQLAAVPPPAPIAMPVVTPVALPAEPPRLVEPPQLVEPEAPSIAPVVAEPEMTDAAPAPPPLSTVARTPPPKVRGLRRMIGALRHL